MIVLKTKDKRHANGYGIKFFSEKTEVTEEIIDYVVKHKSVYLINTYDKVYTREEFLESFVNKQ